MSTEITRSPAVIADEINSIKSQTSGILTAALTYAKRSCFEIGKRLEEAKSIVAHGEWGEWLEKHVDYSVSTANDLMRIYREFGGEQIDMLTGKSDAETFEGLSQSQMVALFGLPRAMRADFVEQHREELESGELSSRKLKDEIKRLNGELAEKEREHEEKVEKLTEQITEFEEKNEELTSQIEDAEERARDLQLRIDEFEGRPIEVEKITEKIYEASPEQVEEIRAAALKEAEEKHQKVADKKQKEIDKLSEQLGQKNAEFEKKLNEERAAADKKLRQLTAQSDPRAAKISYCLETIGRAMADINGVVTAMNSENAGSGDQMRFKCEAALMRLCNTYGWQV